MEKIRNHILPDVQVVSAVDDIEVYKKIDATIAVQSLRANILFITMSDGSQVATMSDHYLSMLLHRKLDSLRYWYEKKENRNGIRLEGLNAIEFANGYRVYDKSFLSKEGIAILFAFEDIMELVKGIEGNKKKTLTKENKIALKNIREKIEQAFIEASNSRIKEIFTLKNQNIMAKNVYKDCTFTNGTNATFNIGDNNNGIGGNNNQLQSGTNNEATNNDAGGDVNNSQSFLETLWNQIVKGIKKIFS